MSKRVVPRKLPEHPAFNQLEVLEQSRDFEKPRQRRKARPPTLPKQPPPHPPREEWAMFKDCPDDELEDCCQYELAREVDWIRGAVSRYCKQKNSVGQSVIDFEHECHFSLQLACVLFHVRDFFPKTPWLGIPTKERHWLPKDKDKLRELHPADREFVERGGGGVEKLKVPKFDADGKLTHIYQNKVDCAEGGAPVTYIVWRVNWQKKNNVLVAEFEAWLKRWRSSYSPPRETKGETSPRDTLKALGAMRWLQRMAWDAAEVETTDLLAGSPLYTDKGAWDNARAKAQKAVREFSAFQERIAGPFDKVFR